MAFTHSSSHQAFTGFNSSSISGARFHSSFNSSSISDQSLLRKRMMDNRTDCDLLSDLPLNIIHSILALVPIRDAVRTCILSKQWRYIWASLPHIVFNDKCVDETISADGCIDCLKTMVNNVLFLHKVPLQKFVLEFTSLNRCPNTDLWLLWLSTKEIQELCLKMSYPAREDDRFEVHSSLYSCRKLTHLKLSYCELPPPHQTFRGFSCLRSLFLYCVEVPSDVVESLVANSPLLEEFISHYSPITTPVSELRISAPILKRFHLSGVYKEISLHAPLVDEVSVELFGYGFNAAQQSSVCNYIKFLGGLTNLKYLMVSGSFTKYLSIGIESYNHSLVFHHLKLIRLKNVSFIDKKQIAFVGHLIISAPNLQTLEIKTRHSYASEPLDFGWASNLTFNKLRVLQMEVRMALDDLSRFPRELEFIKISA